MQDRHYYELILENVPCHLYFDLEYEFDENVDKNGELMISQFIEVFQSLNQFITQQLLEKFNITGFEVIDLTSTTETKFSRHLIFRHDLFKFVNNIEAGM